VCLVYIQMIHSQFFKGNYIILFLFLIQLLQSCHQRFSGLFNLLYRIAAAILLISCTLDCDFQIVNLLPQHGFLPLIRDWDTLKLGMTDDNRIIVSHSDSGTELFPVRRFKIFLGCHQDIGSRI